jgi:hypothetical protein
MVELVKSGVCFANGFKEPHMRKGANDVLDFTGIAVRTQQVYNHLRKWRHKWSVITLMKNEGKLKWCDNGTCFILEGDGNLREHLKVIHSVLVIVPSCFVLAEMS